MQLIKTLTALAASMAFTAAAPTGLIEKRQSYTGYASIYYQGDVAGSCGVYNSDDAMVVSVSESLGHNALCGRTMRVINRGPFTDNSIGGNGNVVYVTVADTCPGCINDPGHVDLSKAAWSALTNGAPDSVVGVIWEMV